ncbi:helix-turn-helix domain-containing protein [Micromonospora sp. WMMA1923]|uniref:helix-turn-helix domain-containing protein n=1 Tax=Micromonospora sp. WMMA1923 TaxID=3404125 RepID=UPI003B954BFB
MPHQPLTPATQAVLDALTELGQGDVHALADKAGKARSTTEKAIKTLVDAGLVSAVDTGPEAADGTPTRWTLTEVPEGADSTSQDTSPDETPAGPDAPTDAGPAADPDTVHTEPDAESGPDGPDDEPAGQSADPVDTEAQDPADREAEADDPQNTAPGTEPGDDDPEGPDEPTDPNGDTDATAGPQGEPNTRGDEVLRPVAALTPVRPGDRKIMAIKGVLADHGDDAATLDTIVAESGIGHATATRLLTAMEQADAARRLPGLPQRWVTGPTKASEVDPNPEPPRCPLCRQVLRGLATAPHTTTAVEPLIRPDGTLHIAGPDGDIHVVTLPARTSPRTTGLPRYAGRHGGEGTVNADGSQPFGRGELEKHTLDVLTGNPGMAMTPQDIATVLSGQLNRAVSNGAVRNNLTKAAAAGRILLASDAPLTFVYPAQPDSDTTTQP